MDDRRRRREAREPLPVPLSSGVAIAAAVGFTIVVGLFPEWLLSAAEATTQFAR